MRIEPAFSCSTLYSTATRGSETEPRSRRRQAPGTRATAPWPRDPCSSTRSTTGGVGSFRRRRASRRAREPRPRRRSSAIERNSDPASRSRRRDSGQLGERYEPDVDHAQGRPGGGERGARPGTGVKEEEQSMVGPTRLRRARRSVPASPAGSPEPRSGQRYVGTRLRVVTVIHGSSYGVVQPHAVSSGRSETAAREKARAATAPSHRSVRGAAAPRRGRRALPAPAQRTA